MCGIAGLYRPDGATPDAGVLAAMTARLARRGPDGEGRHLESGIALGHRRLAIIDLSDRGRQPMGNEDGTLWLVFNGEIYNHRELRGELEPRHRFSSGADSEVLLHLYEELGDDPARFLGRVRGMFAFALWDRPRRRLLLARDRLGIKPLFYHAGPDGLVFASDLDALTACPAVPRRLDWTSLYEYLVLLTVPGPSTMFEGVRQLPAGHLFLCGQDEPRPRRYWSPSARGASIVEDAGEADELLGAALGDAIDRHLVADVEVGAFLSGGIDSSLVAALAAERSGRPLRTLVATFPGEPQDEAIWARRVAERTGAAHEELAVTGGFLDGIEEVVGAMDQPLALSSAVSLYHLSREARRGLKVVLTGDGGDELLAGYRRHAPYPAPSALAAWLPAGLRRPVGRLGLRALPAWAGRAWPTLGRARALAGVLARDEAALYAPRLYTMSPAEALALVPAGARAQIDQGRYLRRVQALFDGCEQREPLQRMLEVDLQTSLADEMLTKVDRMTMAWGLEARVPLLDDRVVEAALRVAGALKRRGEVGKLPLRRMVERHLGGDVATRPKSGFNSPFAAWLRREPHTREAFAAGWSAALASGVFEPGGLADLRGRFEREAGGSAQNLFAVLIAGLWAAQRRLGAA